MANGVADSEKQHAILLGCCGSATYCLIQSLELQASLQPLLMAHFNPGLSKIMSYFKFNSFSQQPGESLIEVNTVL